MLNWKRKFKWILKGLAGGGAGLLLFLLVALGLAQIPFVKGKIAGLLSRRLGASLQMDVRVERIHGFIPFDFICSGITAADNESTWLRVDQIHVKYSPFSLLLGRVNIEKIALSNIELERWPQELKTAHESPVGGGPFQLLERLPSVTIQSLKAGDVTLATSVLGQRLSLSLEGNLHMGKPPNIFQTLLKIREKDLPHELVSIDANILGNPPELNFSLEASEKNNGFFPRLLGLREAGAFHFLLEGEGSLENWCGVVRTDLERYGSIHSQIHLEAADDVHMEATGEIVIESSMIPHQIAPLVNEQIDFSLAGALEVTKQLTVDRLHLETGMTSADFWGTYDPRARSLESRLTIGVSDLSPVQSLAGIPISGSATFQCDAQGTIQKPEAELAFRVYKPRIANVMAQQIEMQINVHLLDEITSVPPRLGVMGKGGVEEFTYMADEKIYEPKVDFSFDVESAALNQILIRSIHLSSQHTNLQIQGLVDANVPCATLASMCRIESLRRYGQLAGMDVDGVLKLNADLLADAASNMLSADVSGEVSALKGAPELAAVLLGPAFDWTGRLEFIPGNRMNLSDFHLQGRVASVSAAASMNVNQKRINADWTLSIPKLTPLSSTVGYPLSGDFILRGDASGSLQDLQINTILESKHLTAENLTFDIVRANLSASQIPQSPQGALVMEAVCKDKTLTFQTDFRAQESLFVLTNVNLSGPEIDINGFLRADLVKQWISADLEGRSDDLSALGNFLGQPLAGRLNFLASFKPGMEGQKITFDLNASDAQSPFAEFKRARIQAELDDAFRDPSGKLSLSIESFKNAGITIKSLNAKASNEKRRIEWTCQGQGEWKHLFEFQSMGHSEFAAIPKVIIDTLQGQYDGIPFSLTGNAELNIPQKKYTLETLEAHLGSGEIRASGQYQPQIVELDLSLDGIPLELSKYVLTSVPPFSGVLQAKLNVSGSPVRPVVQSEIMAYKLRINHPQLQKIPETKTEINARYAGEEVLLDFKILDLFNTPLTASLMIPATFSLEPVRFSTFTGNNLRGRITGEMDLELMSTLLSLEGQKFSGRLITDLEMKGTLQEPDFSGNINLEKGSYDNLDLGVMLRDIHAELLAAGRQVIIQKFQLTDGGAGVVTASGNIAFASNTPLSLNMEFDQATLARMDNVTAVIEGMLTLSGEPNNLKLDGKMEITPIEIHVLEPLPKEIEEIQIIRAGQMEQADSPGIKPDKNRPQGNVTLNLQILIPNRMFVRGPGLESEWSGNLLITGTAPNPILKGNLSVVRGRFNFFGNRFNLTSGSITFQGSQSVDIFGNPFNLTSGLNALHGSQSIDIFLDLVTETTKKNITYYLRITGPVNSPKLNLESNPPLASDEVLSRLLFNRRLTDITPLQALQLAQAANALRGGSDAFDLMGKTRNLLGVDQLELRQEQGGSMGDTMVGVGKYLTEKIYVDLEQGLGKEMGKVSVEVQLTPFISIVGEVGVDHRSGIGLFWKYDF